MGDAAQSCLGSSSEFGVPIRKGNATGDHSMKRTAVLIDFAKELEGTNDRIFDEIMTVLKERGIEPSITFKEYEDDYGGPVIYFP